MIFYLLVVALFVGLLLCGLARYGNRFSNSDFENKKTIKDKINFLLYLNDYELAKTGFYTTIMSIGLMVIFSIIVVSNYTDAKPTRAKLEQKYEALLFKGENSFVRDEFGLVNKELVDEIQSWNEELSYYQELRDNKLFGVLVTPAYDNLKTIDLNQTFNK